MCISKISVRSSETPSLEKRTNEPVNFEKAKVELLGARMVEAGCSILTMEDSRMSVFAGALGDNSRMSCALMPEELDSRMSCALLPEEPNSRASNLLDSELLSSTSIAAESRGRLFVDRSGDSRSVLHLPATLVGTEGFEEKALPPLPEAAAEDRHYNVVVQAQWMQAESSTSSEDAVADESASSDCTGTTWKV